MRVLLIEDDPMIGKAVLQGMRNASFSVDWVQRASAAEQALSTDVYALVILDLGLPGKDGLQILKKLREQGSATPVVIATARDAVADRINGLNLGADDYVVKPFDLHELIARVRAVLRRHAGSGNPVLEFGGLLLDPIHKTVSRAGVPLDVSRREFAILEILMRNPGAVVSRELLEDSVYGWGEEVGSNAVEVHLHNLRKKLGPERIKNVRGVGYRITES